MEKIKVSIVTISYNQVDFLEDCINSVINQGYENIEYIIVDPGSKDGSRELISKYSGKVQHIINDVDSGPSQGLNNGFNVASGDIFGFLNADDILLPDAIQNIVDFFVSNPFTDVVCGHGYQIDGAGNVIKKVFSTSWGPKYFAYGLSGIVQQSTFFKKEIFYKVDGFNEENKTCWDGELFLKMAMADGDFKILKKYIGAFRIHESSSTGQGVNNPRWEKYLEDRERLEHLALGRKLSRLDVLFIKIHQFYRYLVNPRSTFYKVFKKIIKI